MMRLRELRESKELKQIEVAKALGITQRQLSSWECGVYEPDVAMLISLADYFDVTIDYLVGRTDEF